MFIVLSKVDQKTDRKKETSKHSGAIALFNKDFVKQGIFKKDYSRWLHDAFDLRQRSDYAAEYHVSGIKKGALDAPSVRLLIDHLTR